MIDYANECMESTISLVLAGLAYDEDNVVDKIKMLFPSLKPHFWGHNGGSHFHGVVEDKNRKRIRSVGRGTDGYRFGGKLLSWMTNARLLKTKEGFHRGFYRYAERSFKLERHYLENYEYINMGDHSQGCGYGVIEAYLICKYLKSVKHVTCSLFSAPPAMDERGAKLINDYIESGKLSIDNYWTPGDPISSRVLRNPDSILFNGKDVGTSIKLPDLIEAKRYRIVDVVSHSPRMNIAAFIIHLIDRCNDMPKADFKLLAQALRMMVN